MIVKFNVYKLYDITTKQAFIPETAWHLCPKSLFFLSCRSELRSSNITIGPRQLGKITCFQQTICTKNFWLHLIPCHMEKSTILMLGKVLFQCLAKTAGVWKQLSKKEKDDVFSPDRHHFRSNLSIIFVVTILPKCKGNAFVHHFHFICELNCERMIESAFLESQLINTSTNKNEC